MKKTTIFLILICLSFIVALFFYMDRDLLRFKKTVADLNHAYPFEEYSTHIDVRIQESDLIINLSLVDSYSEYTVLKQYLILEYFSLELEHILKNNSAKKSIDISNVIIKGYSNSQSFELHRTYKNGTSLFNSDSIFKINGIEAYTSDFLKKSLKHHQQNLLLTEREKEIVQYGQYMLDMLTLNGSYYYPNKDNKINAEIIRKRYNLTVDELKVIYWKYLYNIIIHNQ